MASSQRRFDPVDFPDQQLTGLVVASGHEVHRAFGYGFLESVYRRALVAELRHRGVFVEEEKPFRLFHRGTDVGLYKADVIAESRVIIEVKTGPLPNPEAPVQLLNYLSAARIALGLVFNFCPKLHIKRMIRSEEIEG